MPKHPKEIGSTPVTVTFGAIVCDGFVDAELLPLPDITLTVLRYSVAADLLLRMFQEDIEAPFTGYDVPCWARVVDLDYPTSGTCAFTIQRNRI